MFRNRVLTLSLTGLVVLGLASCGDEQAVSPANGADTESSAPAGSDEPAESEEPAESDEPAGGTSPGDVDLEAAKEFVTITACEGVPAHSAGVSATVEVTNTLDEPVEYYGAVNFLDGSGIVLTQGVFNTGTLEPGATSTEDVPGPNLYEAVPKVSCELIDLKSDNPA